MRWGDCGSARQAGDEAGPGTLFLGETRTQGKTLSLFEPSTEVIRKSKAAKPNEFGKMVKLQEAENQIVVTTRSTPAVPTMLTC